MITLRYCEQCDAIIYPNAVKAVDFKGEAIICKKDLSPGVKGRTGRYCACPVMIAHVEVK